MSKSKQGIRLSESEIKLAIGDWLTELGLTVFDEKRNIKRPQWGIFEVKNIERGKRPDLVVHGVLRGAQKSMSAYIAVEIKRGYKHHDILDGFDAVLEYLSDYIWGADYRIGNRSIEISAFVLGTFFSQQGYLFQEEGKFDPHGIVRGPWDAYPMTFTIARLLWRQRDNLIKRFHSLCGIPKVEKKLSKQKIPGFGKS